MTRLRLSDVGSLFHEKYFSWPLMRALEVLASDKDVLQINGKSVGHFVRTKNARNYFAALLKACVDGGFKLPSATPEQIKSVVEADQQFVSKVKGWLKPSERKPGFSKKKNYSKQQRKIFELLRKLFDYDSFVDGKGWKYSKKDKEIRSINLGDQNITWRAFEFHRQIVGTNNLRYCPYCNAETVFLLSDIKSKSGESRSHLDHFYPRSAFPYLGVSLYNLVPVCAHCNSSMKGDKIPFEAKVFWPNPYAEDFNELARFRYIKDPCEVVLGGDNNKVNLEVVEGQNGCGAELYAKEMNVVTKYNQAYGREINELPHRLRLAMTISPSLAADLLDNDDAQYESRYMLNCSLDERNIHAERLSKMTIDLVDQLVGE